MKSLKDFISEAKKEEWQEIFNKCKEFQGKATDKDANEVIDMIKDYFNSHDEASLKEFRKDYKAASLYLFFNDENYVICTWNVNNATFIASTIRYFKNNYYIHGNLYYNPREMFDSISFHFEDESKMKVWEITSYKL